jgi:hypothetical protein
MTTLNDYTEAGLVLAVALANVGSRDRRGDTASPAQAITLVRDARSSRPFSGRQDRSEADPERDDGQCFARIL